MNGINSEDRGILTYRPGLGYEPKILTKVESTSSYKMPPALQALTNVLPSSILDEITGLLGDIDVLAKRMEMCLQDDVADGISFKDYQKEKKSAEPNYDTINKYENYHKSDINGSTQGEVYPMLLDLSDELTGYRDFLNKQFYNGNANYDYIDTIRDKEKAQIEKHVENDINGELGNSDFNKLQVQAQISNYAMTRVDNAKIFIKDLNKVLCSTTNAYYNGNVKSVVKQYATASTSVLGDLNGMNKVRFNETVVKAQQDSRRDSKLNTPEIKQGMNDIAKKIADMKTSGADNVLNWIKNINTEHDTSPVTKIVADALDRIEFVNSEYNKVVTELYKHNELDAMLKQDQIGTLLDKKQARQVFNLISDIITEKDNNTFDLDKFIADKKLEHPGTLCTK